MGLYICEITLQILEFLVKDSNKKIRGDFMKYKSYCGLAILALGVFVLNTGCLFTRIDEQLMKARHYETYQPREYFEPVKYISAGGVDYAYIEKGEGPTVILLHGGIVTFDIGKSLEVNPYWDSLALLLGGGFIVPGRAQSLLHFGAISTINTWEYNFNELAKKFNVIALDLPGFGNSSKPDTRYTIPEMTVYLNQFLEAKGLKKVYLVGHDYSGLLAIDYALTYPEKISGLILIAPYGTESHPFYYPVHLVWHYPRWIARNLYRDKAGRVDIYRNVLNKKGESTYRKLFYKPESRLIEDTSSQYGRLIYNDNEQAKKFVDGIIKYKFESNWLNTREFADELIATHLSLQDVGRKDYWGIISLKDEKRTDWVTRVKFIQAPTLILWGKYDPLISVEEASYLDHVIPNSSLNVFEKSAHYPMVEESEEFNQQVLRFLSGVEATSIATK